MDTPDMDDVDALLFAIAHRVVVQPKHTTKTISSYIDLLYKSFGVNKARPAHVYYRIAYWLWKANKTYLAKDYASRVPRASFRLVLHNDECAEWNDVSWLKDSFESHFEKI